MKINVQTDCGNSPKMELLRDFNIAFFKRDKERTLQFLSEDIEWTMIGQSITKGLEKVSLLLDEMFESPFTELTIENVMSHGKVGAVNGTITMEDGQMVEFCDVYEFSNAKGEKIKSIKGYALEIK